MDPLDHRAKRRKPNPEAKAAIEEMETEELEVVTASMKRPISPPMSRRRRSVTPEVETPRVLARHASLKQPPTLGEAIVEVQQDDETNDLLAEVPREQEGVDEDQGVTNTPVFGSVTQGLQQQHQDGSPEGSRKYIPSPIQLTRIQDLPMESNLDTVGLEDILGDVMIRECWNFNFLFDIDWVMSKFDPDVRSSVAVKFIHGFWRREDERRTDMMEAADRYEKVDLVSAYIPDPFGTHHSKMLVLLRHDDTAQVIIHTANMISRDWGNMTQAVWRSPHLPLMTSLTKSQAGPQNYPIGSGQRFKVDLFGYLNAYEKKLRGLTEQLVNYDFSAIRAAFIGSAPSRQKPAEGRPLKQTSFGWLGVREILSTIPTSTTEDSSSAPNIVIQTSSIATLGGLPTWLTHLQSVLSRSSKSTAVAPAIAPTFSKASTFFAKRAPTAAQPKTKPPTFNVIFPTASEIRSSLDGYSSGFSIHTKLQSPQQQKQLEYLRPILCHWSHHTYSSLQTPAKTDLHRIRKEAHRGAAAPHIKTYIRFSNQERKFINWAMVTSANLSKQAWGEMENKKDEVWIQSWETGVVVWPELFKESEGEKVRMVPVFGRDEPRVEDVDGDVRNGKREGEDWKGTVVGFRMPYDLPLEPYGDKEVPWCASAEHKELDWKGQAWSGYHPH